MKKIMLTIGFAIILLYCSEPLWAMHCGKKIVTEGDHKYEVLAACGQPASREVVGVDNKHVGEYRLLRSGCTLSKNTATNICICWNLTAMDSCERSNGWGNKN